MGTCVLPACCLRSHLCLSLSLPSPCTVPRYTYDHCSACWPFDRPRPAFNPTTRHASPQPIDAVGVAVGSALFGSVIMKRTNIIPASKRVLRRVITGALGAGGFVSGVAAHQQTCVDRILELDDSPLAEELRKFATTAQKAERRKPKQFGVLALLLCALPRLCERQLTLRVPFCAAFGSLSKDRCVYTVSHRHDVSGGMGTADGGAGSAPIQDVRFSSGSDNKVIGGSTASVSAL